MTYQDNNTLIAFGVWFIAITWILVWKFGPKRARRTAGTPPPLDNQLRVVHAYLTALAVHQVSLIGAQGRATLKVLNPVPHNYRLTAGESLLAAMEVSLIETVATGRNESFRSYDNTGYYSAEKADQVTAVGKLLITTRALVFQSGTCNHRWQWSKISNVEILPYAFKVHMRSGSPKLFGFTEHDLEFAKVMVTQANI
jgi:hypothetical protein